ncbi:MULTISPECIES: CarD family transcriptional regulator [unclassified Pseudactinotalea]|uniref:CarD family transcriptional regulator n=1 Tax=unclassified Pseudactinotalea TaxID=2649176 RepID=UPI003C7B8248
MNFTKGQVIVHPHHGPATITKTTTRTLRGTRIRYLKLQVSGTDLVVEVPEERAEETGLRPVLGIEDLREIFDVLAAPSEEEPSNWSRRIKANTDRFRSGDIRTIAGLVRDLSRRLDGKGLSFGEKNLLRDALIPLVAEISIVLSMDEAETEATIDAAILQGTIPPMPALAAAS